MKFECYYQLNDESCVFYALPECVQKCKCMSQAQGLLDFCQLPCAQAKIRRGPFGGRKQSSNFTALALKKQTSTQTNEITNMCFYGSPP